MHVAMPVYFTRQYVRQVQMALNEKNKMNLPTTGRFSAAWVEALKGYQICHGLLPTAKYDEKTQAELEPFLHFKYLQEQDYDTAAEILGCETAVIRAIVLTFVSGSGFISNGKCRIVFKREKFYTEIGKRYSRTELEELTRKHPTIVRAAGGGYLCDDYEYVRFCAAVALDSYAAMLTTQWGMFQIPGANYRQCGYATITAFAVGMQSSERNQLHALARLIKASPRLHKAIREKHWENFCREYVGEGCELYEYDKRISRHYRELTRAKKVPTTV